MRGKVTVNMEIKQLNRYNIYHIIRSESLLSRRDIVTRLKLSLPTVTQNIVQLMEEGLIEEVGSVGNTGGRRAKTYDIIDNAKVAIGLDITRNHITVVAVNLRGEIIRRIRVRALFEQNDKYYKELGDLIEKLIKEEKLDKEKILGVGIGVPGLITEDGQRVFYGKILDFTGATCKEFSKFIPFESSFVNDATAAGYAETWESTDNRNAFYIMLSNNVGGAITINNEVYAGENIRGGEVGHYTIVPDGRECYCGQKGCVDPYLAATLLSDLTNGNLEEFFRLLDKGDTKVKDIWEEYLYYLSVTVNSLRVLFDCNIILGGYVGAYMENYIDDLKELATKRSTFEDNADYLQVCIYKKESIAAGAAIPYINDFLATI